MSADFTPSFGVYKETGSFKFWCQKVLPLVYDDSLSYYETLCKVVKYLNDVIANVDVLHDDVDALRSAYIQLQSYVNSYFDNLDVQNEINQKLDDMADDGSLSALLSPIVATQIGGVVGEQIDAVVGEQIDASVGRQIDESVASQIGTPTANATTAWLNEHVNPVGSAVVVDDTLTIEGAAADAKVCGDEFSRLNNALTNVAKDLHASGYYYNNPSLWLNKTLTPAGVESDSNTSILTDEYISDDVTDISCASGYGFYVYSASKDGTWKGVWTGSVWSKSTASYKMTSYHITRTNTYYYYRVRVVKDSGANITPSEYQAVSFTIPPKTYDSVIKDSTDFTEIGNGYYNAIGVISSASGWTTYDCLIPPFCTAIVTTGRINANVYCGVIDDTNNVLSNHVYDAATVTLTNSGYGKKVRFSIYTGDTVTIEIRVDLENRIDGLAIDNQTKNVLNPLGKLGETPFYIKEFRQISCIGDSLTQGVYDSNQGTKVLADVSYPVILEKITGVPVVNLGIASSTAKQDASGWYQRLVNRTDSPVLTDFTNKKSDAYIIALGTNDIGNNGSFDGDISTDINTEDYTQNAVTSVGGYAQVIQRILELQPKAKIFCVTIPKSRNDSASRAVANTKIKAIASMFDCYVIDLETYDMTFNKDTMMNTSHNNSAGYTMRAWQYATYIEWIIENNFTDFNETQFIGTDYTYGS